MPTPRSHSSVSRALVLTCAIALGACASAPVHQRPEQPASDQAPVTVRFDNDGRDYVQVYLVGPMRQWMLGRVAPGARATLRVPDDALAEEAGSVQLVAVPGGHATARALAEARAVTTIAQPAAAFVSQRWTFSQAFSAGQLTPLPLPR